MTRKEIKIMDLVMLLAGVALAVGGAHYLVDDGSSIANTLMQ